jgi:glycosyltransferase involved in cell wall biosynthesis
LIVGIDASRNKSGGAKAHLQGIIAEANPEAFGVTKVHLWAYDSLLNSLPNKPWLVKHCPDALSKNLFKQIWWQYFKLHKEAKQLGVNIMLNTDAGTVGKFKPCIVMSRDMLSYEKGEMQRYGWSKARLRLIALKYVQAFSLKKATAAIFLTQYAANIIQAFSGKIQRVAIIPHGVGNQFKTGHTNVININNKTTKCLYVSNAAPYKHQWHVVKAIELLRKKGYDITLTLVGGGSGKAQQQLTVQMQLSDPHMEFVEQLSFLPHADLPKIISEKDIFIFASSCENMPNTLVEGMAGGKPIACSNRGPMPEVLQDAGLYFNPENPESIAEAVEKLVIDKELQMQLAKKAYERSQLYSWKRCSNETFLYLKEIYTTQ